MNIVFRCDASIQIGTGHVMRCLTLADELARQAAKCHFICREHEGNLIDFIAQKGYEVYKLEAVYLDDNVKGDIEPILFHSQWLGTSQDEDAQQTINIVNTIQPEWLVIDNYALDSYWEEKLRPHCNNILVIDDLADRKHDCDVLLDQTYGRNNKDYQNLVPNHCEILCGTTYALLRPEFSKWRQYSLERRKDNSVNNILINLGGVDKDNITSRILESLKQATLPELCTITVVMGSNSPWLDTVTTKANQLPWLTEVKTGVSNMAELMANSDLAIGAAGSTSWERCCLGLPTIMLVLAENQLLIAKNLQDVGAVFLTKLHDTLRVDLNIDRIINEDKLFNMSKSASLICDGLGVQRACKLLSNSTNNRV